MFFLDCEGLGKRQIQPFADVLQNRWSSKFRKACNFIKKRLKHKLFPGEYCKIFKNVFNKIPLVAASEKSFREFSSHNHTCLKQRERKKLKQRFWILLKDFVPVCLQAPFNDRGVATGRGGGGQGVIPPHQFPNQTRSNWFSFRHQICCFLRMFRIIRTRNFTVYYKFWTIYGSFSFFLTT